jgi:hypothetical protein
MCLTKVRDSWYPAVRGHCNYFFLVSRVLVGLNTQTNMGCKMAILPLIFYEKDLGFFVFSVRNF